MSSRKQSDYLSALLNDAPSPPAVPISAPVAASVQVAQSPAAPKSAMTLLARDSALTRVANGEVRQVTQLLLDPARVRIWQGNARHQPSLNYAACEDLIEAILAEGGQKVPAIVRKVANDPAYDYEVIAGSRRHWSVSWLRANSYPDTMFLAQVYTLDDEAAFRISDIENRARKDVSDFERARTYLDALDQHYGGKQVRMAERLRVSKGWLSKMLTVATLPDWIVSAFSGPADIQLKTAYPLAQKLQARASDGSAYPARLRSEADYLTTEQASRLEDGRPGIPAAEVLARLMAVEVASEEPQTTISFDMPSGRTALSVLSANRNGVSIRLHAGSGASDVDLAKLLKSALQELDKQGRGLRL
jgi:ParB family chromosome partitioning protein